ncbi:MAG: ribonuclease P protein component [bacterium]
MKYSFPKEGRLGRKEFREVCRQGKVLVSPWLILYYKPDEQWGAGFGTTRDVRKAVERNLLRRRLREAYRLLRPRLSPFYKIVIIGKGNALSLSFQELQAEIEKLLKKGKILTESGQKSDGQNP